MMKEIMDFLMEPKDLGKVSLSTERFFMLLMSSFWVSSHQILSAEKVFCWEFQIEKFIRVRDMYVTKSCLPHTGPKVL